jgi:hypothetical protein
LQKSSNKNLRTSKEFLPKVAEKSFSRGSDPRKPGWAAVAVVIPDVDDVVQLIVVAGCLAAGHVVVGTENESENDFEGLGLLLENTLNIIYLDQRI